MRPDLLRLMTWADIDEIVTEYSAVGESEQSDENYCCEVLRRLRVKNSLLPPVSDRFATVLAAAQVATGWLLTSTRERGNTRIRSFVAFKLHSEGYSYSEIGKLIGRDHSTVTYLDNKVKDMLSVPGAYKNEIVLYRKFEALC